MSEPLLYETHMHTPLCKHAVGEPEAYAAAAQQRGLKGIVVTCHNPVPGGFSAGVRMTMEQFDEYVQLVEHARREWFGVVDVRLGLECDYMPGMEKFLEKQLAWTKFHHILGSVHPHTLEYRQTFWKNDVIAFQRIYFEHLAMAAETKLFDTISHPDLVKNSNPYEWFLPRVMDHVCACLDRIAKTGVAMELNTSGRNKSVPEMNPGPEILREMCMREIPVVIGADAHEPGRVADGFLDAMDLLEQAGYTQVSLYLDRVRYDIPIGIARQSLQRN